MSQRHLTRLVLAVVCAGLSASLLAQVPPPGERSPDLPVEREAGPRPGVEPVERAPVQFHTGARVRIGGDVTIPEGERVTDVVTVFGNIELNGIADGNVVAVFGDVVVGPRALARSDVAAIGGRVIGAEGASIWGSLTQVGWSLPDIRFTLGDRNMTTVEVVPDWPRIARVQWWLTLGGTALLGLLCAFAVMAAPRAVDASMQGSRPVLAAWLVGMLVQVLGLPLLAGLSVLLVATVIGIPLLAAVPFLLLGLLAMSVVGVTAFAVRVGNRLLPISFRSSPSVVALVAGFVVLAAPVVAGSYLWTLSRGASIPALVLIVLGTFVEYMWWTVGMGAGVRAWWSRRRRKAPPARAETPAAPIDPAAPSDPPAPLDTLPLPSGI